MLPQLTVLGDFCEIDVNECEKNFGSCLNGGTCENLHGGYRCNCKEGFRGKFRYYGSRPY